jgi:NitT/TauT family transport system permease protein
MPKWLPSTRTLRALLFWLLVIAAWEAAYRTIGWRTLVFPAPSHVLDATLDMLGVHTQFGDALRPGWPWPQTQRARPGGAVLPTAILVSGVRLAIGFAISLVLGGAIGLLMWRYHAVDDALGPVFLGLQTLPSVCWVPLAILALGINEASIIFVLVMGSFFSIAIALRDGLRQIPPIYTKAALMLGARRWNLYRHVLLPAGLPALAGSLRQGFSFAWRSLMGAELLLMLSHRGLGFWLTAGREFSDVAQVVAVMVVMVLMGTLADRLVFVKIERAVQLRFGLA